MIHAYTNLLRTPWPKARLVSTLCGKSVPRQQIAKEYGLSITCMTCAKHAEEILVGLTTLTTLAQKQSQLHRALKSEIELARSLLGFNVGNWTFRYRGKFADTEYCVWEHSGTKTYTWVIGEESPDQEPNEVYSSSSDANAGAMRHIDFTLLEEQEHG